ncbi:MAG: ribonuclease HII [Candidatus Kapaibacterium sp.]|jgi:ribonuclease HII|nr:ribonuclease HII [Candidatus Kapabacteria bacterium]
MNLPGLNYENIYWKSGLTVAGIDEAGRGPLAGPVVAAAVVLAPGTILTGLNDSKKMSEKNRLKLYDRIYQNALDVSVAFIDNLVIDEINILQASVKAMKQAVEALRIVPGHLLIDGNYFDDYNIDYTTIVKGDSISLSIAAASVIAKVSRDKWMVDIAATRYPQYGFEKHKGYPTDSHIKAITKYGPCPLHRNTFIKNIVIKQESLFG